MSRSPHIKPVWIPERQLEGFTVGRVGYVDDRISVDDYIPTHPEVRWECDNCESRTPVTAEFCYPKKSLTLCEDCLRHALDGIAYSKAHPTTLDVPEDLVT